jgi:hypothetical protein
MNVFLWFGSTVHKSIILGPSPEIDQTAYTHNFEQFLSAQLSAEFNEHRKSFLK